MLCERIPGWDPSWRPSFFRTMQMLHPVLQAVLEATYLITTKRFSALCLAWLQIFRQSRQRRKTISISHRHGHQMSSLQPPANALSSALQPVVQRLTVSLGIVTRVLPNIRQIVPEIIITYLHLNNYSASAPHKSTGGMWHTTPQSTGP